MIESFVKLLFERLRVNFEEFVCLWRPWMITVNPESPILQPARFKYWRLSRPRMMVLINYRLCSSKVCETCLMNWSYCFRKTDPLPMIVFLLCIDFDTSGDKILVYRVIWSNSSRAYLMSSSSYSNSPLVWQLFNTLFEISNTLRFLSKWTYLWMFISQSIVSIPQLLMYKFVI